MEKVTLENKKIAIIGFGHMGKAIFEGFMNSGKIREENVIISNPSQDELTKLRKKYNIHITSNNRKAARFADFIFIAVKPFIVKDALFEIRNEFKKKIVISLAAVVDISLLKSYVKSNNVKFIRIMPNLSVSINEGVIGIYFGKNIIFKKEKIEVAELLSGLGKVVEVKKEKEIDLLTLISACGPAIVAYFFDLLFDYGKKNSLDKKISQDIILQTFQGTLSYLDRKNTTPLDLKNSVATKGGITETILRYFDKNEMKLRFNKSMDIGKSKIEELLSKLRLEANLK